MKFFLPILLFVIFSSQLNAAQLLLNKQSFIQGQTIQAQIAVTQVLNQSACWFRGKSFPLFIAAPHKWEVLIGTDIGTPTGNYLLSYSGKTINGNIIKLATTLNVVAGQFRSSIIKIPAAKKSIATPSNISNEASVIGPFFNQKTAVKRWDSYFGWPVQGQITTPYGANRVYDNGAMSWWHRGVDIYAPRGTPVLAPNAGKILLSRTFASHGQTIMIDHGHSVVSIYNHLSKRLVQKGDLVKKGSKIGLVGDSGIATGPHLHWGVSVGNVRVDPLFWLSNNIN